LILHLYAKKPTRSSKNKIKCYKFNVTLGAPGSEPWDPGSTINTIGTIQVDNILREQWNTNFFNFLPAIKYVMYYA